MNELLPNRFLLVDGHAVIYRAFYAFPELTDPTGRLVNAVFGFSRILLTAIRDFSPEYIAVAFDHKAPTKRSETFEAYKAHRPQMPEELKPQIEIIKRIVQALNIPQFSQAGQEADDLIGTIGQKLNESGEMAQKNLLVTILTGDKDLLQLVDESIHVFIPSRGKFGKDQEFDEAGVVNKMGVRPNQITDLKALMGDSSDNIPGVKGVGPKTAIKLIQEFGSLEGVYQALESSHEFFKGSLGQKLTTDRDNAYLSKDLATIDRQVQIDFKLADCVVAEYNKNDVASVFEELGFASLIGLLPKDDFEQGVVRALF